MASHLKRRGQIWHLQKTLRFQGRSIHIRRSTGERDRAAAEEVAHAILEAERHKLLYGPHVQKTFHEAATHYQALPGNDTANNRYHLDLLLPYLGSLVLDDLYQDHPKVQQFIQDRRAAGRANNTINRSLEKLRCVLNRATEWREEGKPWLQVAPKIRLLPRQDKTSPAASEAPGYPLSREQADRLIAELCRNKRAAYLADMVAFALYTGCRESEVTALQWDWERQLDHGDGSVKSVFVLPASLTKTARSRVVVLNSRVQRVIGRRRGINDTYVFTFNGHPVGNINNTAWKLARRRAGLDNARGPGKHFRVHDLRTTFATWLRQAGVGREDRKVLLGHAVDDITTHYSHAELATLLGFSERTVTLAGEATYYKDIV